MKPRIAAMLWSMLAASLSGMPAFAHEPLWGETPIVFGSGIIHPEVKVMHMDAGDARDGGERMRMSEKELMTGYGMRPSLNLRLEVPYHNNLRQELIGGQVRSAVINGLGDISLLAKSRFKARQEEGLSIQHTALYGVKLPTGKSHHLDPDGERAAPHDQTGTGKPGLVLGYAVDRETLQDTIWASLEWRRDVGGGFRMGDMIDANIAYGRWLKIANEAKDLGVNLAVGLHGEIHRDDPLGGGRTADNGHRLLGIHVTPIFTKGNNQFRVGVLVPIYRKGPEDHTDFSYEWRVAFETFF
ncbi:MAG: hypothetical protein M3347_00705 [Armatimonadota bacterium]|nr:hypothetical protein [Armatimonadota bacterium]